MPHLRLAVVVLTTSLSMWTAVPSALAKDKFCTEMAKVDAQITAMGKLDGSDQKEVANAFVKTATLMKNTKGVPTKIAKGWKQMTDSYSTYGALTGKATTSAADNKRLDKATQDAMTGSSVVETWATKTCGISLWD
jgi:hypothetical protein